MIFETQLQKDLKDDDIEGSISSAIIKEDKDGLGFFISEGKGLTIVEHSGSVSGYTTQPAFERDGKYGVVIMRNYNWGTTERTCLYGRTFCLGFLTIWK